MFFVTIRDSVTVVSLVGRFSLGRVNLAGRSGDEDRAVAPRVVTVVIVIITLLSIPVTKATHQPPTVETRPHDQHLN